MAIFDKTDFLGLKYPPEARSEPKTCSAICGKPVPAILNHDKNLTGSAGGIREGQNMAHLGASHNARNSSWGQTSELPK